ncbi:MAG: hypothetical protein LBT79_04395 [Elusimicrobiota bacterium]|jgi:hypothetical protein|nr:hypothetical protein [Elusimicrobiota bacterium]
MDNNNLLISTAMLSVIWEQSNKDILELLIPFLEYSIAKNSPIEGINLDINKISSYFKEEFGYRDIPDNVIVTMLKRLCKAKTLRRDNDKFYLIQILDNVVRKFEKERSEIKEQEESVINELNMFFKQNNINISKEETVNSLMEFFNEKGLSVFSETLLLENIQKKHNEINYCIAQFILSVYEKNNVVFYYIIEMVKGFFISTAISMQSNNEHIIKSEFKNADFYFDTRVLLNILGCHLIEVKKATIELLSMLVKKGGKLFCFEHNYQEAYDVIYAYGKSIANIRGYKSIITLEGLDELNYSYNDVQELLSMLRTKIISFGIRIVDVPEYQNVKKDYLIDEVALTQYLLENRNKDTLTEKANDIDVQSISAICRLRNGVFSSSIEQSKAVFVTTSTKLTRLTNDFLLYLYKNNTTPVLFSDTILSAIVWLKHYSTHPDYPKTKLIENALLTLEPTHTLLEKFKNKVDKIRNEGKITEEEAIIMINDRFLKKELVHLTQGNEDKITDSVIDNIRLKLKLCYEKDLRNTLEEDYRKTKESEKQKIIYEKKKTQENILTNIREHGTSVKNKTEKALNVATTIFLIILFLIVVIVNVYMIDIQNLKTFKSISTVFLFVINVLLLIDFFIFKIGYIKRLIIHFGNIRRDKAKEKKKEEYKKLGILD